MIVPLRIPILFFLGFNAISPSSKKQRYITRFSTKDHVIASIVTKQKYESNVLYMNRHHSHGNTLIIYCDNNSMTYLPANLVFHSCIKDIVIDFYFIRDMIQNDQLQASRVNYKDQIAANALTKLLSCQC